MLELVILCLKWKSDVSKDVKGIGSNYIIVKENGCLSLKLLKLITCPFLFTLLSLFFCVARMNINYGNKINVVKKVWETFFPFKILNKRHKYMMTKH